MMENGDGMSFAEMLNESYVEPVKYEPGKKIIAPVIRIGKEWTFLDVSSKSEGYFATSEIVNDDGKIDVKEGDNIAVYFLSSGKNGLKFTTKLGAGAEAQAYLQDASRAGIPVQGTVEKEIKGGYQVKIAGGVRGFCPFSQAGLQRTEPEEFIGRQVDFKIIEYKEEGRNIIVSHRALLEEEHALKLEQLKDSLKPGMTVKGTVSSIKKFGAFIVTEEGLEGLLPISEICWGRVEDINERLTVGQKLEVQIVKLDWEQKRFSFSLKSIQTDPWENISDKYPEGSVHKGKVAKLMTFGAFVTLEEGIDGLIHIGAMAAGRKISHPREAVEVGQELDVRIEKINEEDKRLSLVPTENLCPHLKGKKEVQVAEEDTHMKDYEKYKDNKKQAQSKSLGTFGDLLKAKFKGQDK